MKFHWELKLSQFEQQFYYWSYVSIIFYRKQGIIMNVCLWYLWAICQACQLLGRYIIELLNSLSSKNVDIPTKNIRLLEAGALTTHGPPGCARSAQAILEAANIISGFNILEALLNSRNFFKAFDNGCYLHSSEKQLKV